MTKAIVVRIEGDYVITAQGADLLSAIASQASDAKDEAVSAAATALAAAGVGEYPDTGAGLSGTTEGETFWVDMGDGTGQVYRHDSGPTATPLQKFIIDPTDSGAADIFAGGVPTTAALASSTGGEMVGVANGSTVQQVVDRQPIQVDAYYEAGDGDDWAPAFERAYAAGQTLRRNLVATPAATYRFLSSVDIWPNADGWTPALDLQNSTIILGKETPDVDDEVAGFRVRGIKSGAVANSTGFRMRDGLIDHQNINFSNGTRGVWIENGSGWRITNVDCLNMKMGYHFGNYRYIDGGAVGAQLGIFERMTADGYVLESTGDQTWYAYSDAGDLCTVVPGDSVAAGATEMISLIQTDGHSTNTPRLAIGTLFKNETGSPIEVPATLTSAAMVSAGLTNLGTSPTWQGISASPATYMYYSSGGANIPTAAILSCQNIVRDIEVHGARYAAYVSGCVGPVFERIRSTNGIRGVAAEWGATGGSFLSCTVTDPLSSAFLLGYGCSGWTVNDCSALATSDRWIGEALFNFQLSSGNLYGRRNRTNTRDNVTTGQYHLHISIDCSNVDFELDAVGDCAKAYICVESAINATLNATVPELYQGAAPGDWPDMRNIRLTGSITPVSTKGAGTGATMIALLQITDAVFGDKGLSYVNISQMRADASAVPVRYLKIYEGTTAAKQVNNCVLEDVAFPVQANPVTAASRMILPRRWAHFSRVRNVTNLDDNVERGVADVATPDLTFGKYWRDAGTTALIGILGGQGASSAEGYEGREIVVRGSNSRAWSTVSATSGTRDGLRITGTPVTPTNVQRLVLRYSRDVTSWIGGLT